MSGDEDDGDEENDVSFVVVCLRDALSYAAHTTTGYVSGEQDRLLVFKAEAGLHFGASRHR